MCTKSSSSPQGLGYKTALALNTSISLLSVAVYFSTVFGNQKPPSSFWNGCSSASFRLLFPTSENYCIYISYIIQLWNSNIAVSCPVEKRGRRDGLGYSVH